MKVPAWCLWVVAGVCIVVGAVLIVWALALDGLTQPEATITTGVLAICAAGVAFLGVHRQIASNERQHEAKLAADRAQARRAELLDAVRGTLRLMTELSESMIELQNSRVMYVGTGKSGPWDVDRYRRVTAELGAWWAVFSAMGYDLVATRIAELLVVADAFAKESDDEAGSKQARMRRVLDWYESYADEWALVLTMLQRLLTVDSEALAKLIEAHERPSQTGVDSDG